MRARSFIALLIIALGVTVVPAAPAETFYWSDEANDAPAGTPDLTTTSAAIDTNGVITWTIVSQTLKSFDAQTAVDVRINADASMTTGYGGTDYVIRTAAGVVAFFRWTGTTFEPTSAPGLSASFAFPMTVTLHASAIGSPRVVWFKLRTWGQAPYVEDCCADDAPAAGYWWYFDTSTPNSAPAASTPPSTQSPPGAPANIPTPSIPTPTSPGPPPAPRFSPNVGLPSVNQGHGAPTSLDDAKFPALGVRDTKITQRGAALTITARFTSSVSKAQIRCIVTRGHKRLPTMVGHASGKTATCRATIGTTHKRLTGTMVVKVDGSTTRVPLSLSGADHALK